MTVDIAQGQVEGVFIQSFLQADGIDCELLQEGAGRAYGIGLGPLGEVEIRVPSRQAKRARTLIRRYRSNKKRTSGRDSSPPGHRA